MQISDLVRNTVLVEPLSELSKKLESGRPLVVKAGFDPTSPDLHLGHLVLLNKLKQFQDLGHNVTFLVGGFTARIGDPTGRNDTRPILTKDQVDANAQTYLNQAFKILDRTKTTVMNNEDWLSHVTLPMMLTVMSKVTVAQILARNDFTYRYAGGFPIGMHELVYPILQGYDSYAINADIEIGGSDQLFNLMMGRSIQEAHGCEPQVVMTLPLLLGLDGIRKMSKTYGNSVGLLDTPVNIFGKIMSISDDLMKSYFKVLLGCSEEFAEGLERDLKSNRSNPMEVKLDLAERIVKLLHPEEVAKAARSEWCTQFQKKGLPSVIASTTLRIDTPIWLCHVLTLVDLAQSTNKARALVEGNGVRVNGTRITDVSYNIKSPGKYLIQVGKLKFLEVVIE